MDIYEDMRFIINDYFGYDTRVYIEGITHENDDCIGVHVASTINEDVHNSPNSGRKYELIIAVYSKHAKDARIMAEELSLKLNEIHRDIHPNCGIFNVMANSPLLAFRSVDGSVIYNISAVVDKRGG